MKKEVLALLKTYDPDGYYIVSTMGKKGEDILAWWDGYSPFMDMDTMVHELCHAYTHSGKWNSEKIYVGNKKGLTVKYTKVFKSKKTAKSVPKKLRSNRYRIYVAKPMANLSSNIYGPYGLLNELTAYCWGFNCIYKLYEFANTYQDSPDLWLDYFGSAAGIATAYVEFRYFIENYLFYAKKHNPSVYRGIVGNKAFKRAFKKVDKKFAKLVKGTDKRMAKVAERLQEKGYEVRLEDDFLRIGHDGSFEGRGMGLSEYNAFVHELGKAKYRAIQKKLGLPNVKERAPEIPQPAPSGELMAAEY